MPSSRSSVKRKADRSDLEGHGNTVTSTKSRRLDDAAQDTSLEQESEEPPLPAEGEPAPNDSGENSPPPLPDEEPPDEEENPPLPDEQPPLPQEEPGSSNERVKGDEEEEAPPLPQEPNEDSKGEDRHAWQAVWEPTRQQYYFWNSQTNETTWVNPLQPEASGSASGQISEGTKAEQDPQQSSAELFEQQTGIDHDLAFLDPSLSALSAGGSTLSSAVGYTAQGHFDKRKGKFVPVHEAALGTGGTYDPSRMTHAAQANRQMEAYFDTQSWQEELERRRQEEEQNGGQQQRVTKKDIQRFKQRKMEKRKAKYNWLRS